MGMIFMSEEDVDIKRLIASWLKKLTQDQQLKLEPWVEEILPYAIDWALNHADDMVVKTTKVGTVMAALSVLANAKTKAQFVYGLIVGVGSNFTLDMRQRFAAELFERSREQPADPRSPLDCFYSDKTGGFRPFVAEQERIEISEFNDPFDPPLVRTVGVQRSIETFRQWLEQGDPFIVVGPEGSGKSLMLRSAFKQLKSTQVASLHCNAQTSASHVLQKLLQICSQSTSAQGRVLRPKDTQRLILYLKDINLPTPDKYNTIQLIAFLQQLVTYQGFYDENLDFVHLERVSIVASMNPSSTVGRHVLSPRFTANVRVVTVDYATRDELLHVYTQYLKNILEQPNLGRLSNSSAKLAQCMVDLFTAVKKKFSVDDHRHYLFTPRDITLWTLSLLRYEATSMPSLLECWGYEANRVFRDRLVNREHMMQFDSFLNQQLRQALGYNDNSRAYFTTWSASHNSVVPGLPPMGRVAEDDLKVLMSQGLLAYEREFRELHAHIFEESLNNLARVNRVLSRPGSALLLVGESGVGRRTAALLVSHMLNLEFFSPNVTRDYSVKEFRRDLKTILQSAGIEGKPSVFFLENYQIVNSSFLELLNSLLSSGEVPGLYTSEEIEPMLAPLLDSMKQEGGYRSLYEYFTARIRRNLRVILSLDHGNPNYEAYCASNPALFTRCSVLWLQPWSKESLVIVSNLELEEDTSGMEDKQEIIELAINIHKSIPKASQRNFMDLLNTFKKVYLNKSQSQGGQSSHLKAGLGKLKESEKVVNDLGKNAKEKRELLKQKQKEADDALKQITKAMEKAAERRQEVETLQKQLQEENTKINARKSEVELELASIQPLVEEAQKAVGSIRRDNMNEIKGMRMPPEPIHDVLSAVLRLMGIGDTSWVYMKKFLGEPSVISNIVNFNPRLITPAIRDDVNSFVRKKASSFEPASIQRVSLAAAPMAAWVTALLQYSAILEKIKPLEEDLERATRKLETSQKRVLECEEQLEVLDKQVESLKDNFAKRTAEAEALKADLRKAEETLGSAQELLGKLSGEKDRWEIQLKELQEELSLIPRNSMLSAGFVTYLCGSSEDVRERICKQWRASASSMRYEFKKFMSSESEMLRWKSEGLPGDTLTMENGIGIFTSAKTPLIIDPATNATNWLKLQEATQLEVLNQADPRFNTQLELSVRFGKVLILQEIDKVEPMLFPLLRKNLMKQGPRWVVQIGDKQIDYTDTFKMYMCTRDSSIEIPPHAESVITTINFTVTRSGLEGQLLSIIINHEQPDLEKQKTAMLEKEEKLRVELADLEKKLLGELATAEGNLLENKKLIESLNNTKTSSMSIADALDNSSKLQASLDEQREAYRILASQGSTIYSLLQELKKVNHMYQFSLASFIKLFNAALKKPVNSSSLAEKLQKLGGTLMNMIFMYMSRALFKSDRLAFGLHFVHGVFPELFESNEWQFLKGEVAAAGDAGHLFPGWAGDDRRDEFGIFGATLPKLVNSIQLQNEQLWRPWATSQQCEVDFPSQIKNKISPFQKLLLIKTLRPDRLESAMHQFICEALSLSDISPPPLSIPDLFKSESLNIEPILFIISPGSDPSKELEEFAEEAVGRNRFHQMAMGGGQNEQALQLLREASASGDWVCLKNLHLVTSWLPALEKELKILRPHQNFRLWLTTEPHPKFPAILLQSSLKISYESPPGIKKNLQRTYQAWSVQYIEKGNVQRAQTLFSLAWFHAIVQERRTFIPQGWSKFYEFAFSDVRAGNTLLEQVLAHEPVQWNTLRGLLESSIYGGRIDNEFDMKVLRTYLNQYFSAEALASGQLIGGLRLPRTNSYKEYQQLINQLPETDNPSFFGLPSNIYRSVQRYNSANVVKQLKAISAVSEEHLKFDREEWSSKLGPIWNLWQTLHRSSDKIRLGSLESTDPLETFVYGEASAAFKLLERVHESLENISKVIIGSGLLTSVIEEDAKALLKGEVPDRWTYMWEGPNSPVPWLRALIRRTSALKKWVESARNSTLFNEPLSLGELFHPETFLNALRQLTGRRLNVPMEQLKLASSFDSRMPGSVQLKGLLLQGCEFDRGKLVDAGPESPEVTPIPSISIVWVPSDSSSTQNSSTSVEVPVYHSLERDKLLCTLTIENSGGAAERIISGVALFLSGSE
jgi:dynein heavy chain 2